MSKKKTSFKELLSKGASNPRINVQNVRDQRQKLDTLKRSGQPAAASAQPPAKRATSDAPALLAPKTSATAGGHAAYVYAPTFAGLRPGYAFKTGPQGVGYYLEEGAGAPAEEEVAMPFSQPPQHSLGQRSFAAIAAEEEAEAEAEAEETAAGTLLLARRLALPPTPSPTPSPTPYPYPYP